MDDDGGLSSSHTMIVGHIARKVVLPLRPMRRWSVLALMLTVALIARAAPDDLPRDPVAASDGEHLWFFKTSGTADNPRVVVLHHGPGHEPGEAEQASIVEDMPEAALAVDGRLYCIFRGKRDPVGGYQNRSVSTVKAEVFDARSRGWLYEPAPRARTVADLPGEGRIAGLAALGRDPMVLLTPLPGEGETPRRGDSESGDNAPRASLPVLLQLVQGKSWQEVALPPTASAEHEVSLIAGSSPILLVSSGTGQGEASLAYVIGADGTWVRSDVEVNAARIVDSTVHQGQTFVALATADAAIEIALLRPPHAYPIVRVEQATRGARLIGYGSSLALAAVAPEGDRLILTRIDTERGEIESTEEFRQQLRPALEDFSLLVLVGALLFASLIMFIFRPADPARMTVTPPKGSRIAEPRRRIVALLIDLLPSALLASLILDVPLVQVFDIAHMPMRARHIEQSGPMLLMFILCIAHCTLSELVWGRTLGKALLDCWVVSIDGTAAGVTGILVRNAMKFVALCVPLLFLFVYINQYRQRLGDMAGRTIVVTHHDRVEPADPAADPDA